MILTRRGQSIIYWLNSRLMPASQRKIVFITYIYNEIADPKSFQIFTFKLRFLIILQKLIYVMLQKISFGILYSRHNIIEAFLNL